MAFSFSVRVVRSDGHPRSSVRVGAMDPRPVGFGGQSEYTGSDGWAYFECPDRSSVGLDVYIDGDKQGYYAVEGGDTLSLTVDP